MKYKLRLVQNTFGFESQHAIESKDKQILTLSISKGRNMFVVEHFLSTIVTEYGAVLVSTMVEPGTQWPVSS
jgi:hypothetical protein